MIEVFAVKIEKPIIPVDFEKFLRFINITKQERVLSFRKKEDAERALVGDFLVRSIIIERYGYSNSEIQFDENKYGKPYWPEKEDFCYNLSHSGKYVVCAVDNHPVGIDVQIIRPISIEIAKRFFSRTEYEYIIKHNEEEHLSVFYDIWTLKESYIKAIGRGLSIPLNSFSVITNDSDIQVKTENGEVWFLKQYTVSPEYKLAVCAKRGGFPEAFKEIKVEVLFKKVLSLSQ